MDDFSGNTNTNVYKKMLQETSGIRKQACHITSYSQWTIYLVYFVYLSGWLELTDIEEMKCHQSHCQLHPQEMIAAYQNEVGYQFASHHLEISH